MVRFHHNSRGLGRTPNQFGMTCQPRDSPSNGTVHWNCFLFAHDCVEFYRTDDSRAKANIKLLAQFPSEPEKFPSVRASVHIASFLASRIATLRPRIRRSGRRKMSEFCHQRRTSSTFSLIRHKNPRVSIGKFQKSFKQFYVRLPIFFFKDSEPPFSDRALSGGLSIAVRLAFESGSR
jgi:hypothetical protein